MPKYVLTWGERVNNWYKSDVIEADSEEEAWRMLWDGDGGWPEMEDCDVIDSFDHEAEEVE